MGKVVPGMKRHAPDGDFQVRPLKGMTTQSQRWSLTSLARTMDQQTTEAMTAK
jgi:hypothetical protein